MMEIASITGHKSLSMLKRYTHLRAQKLAKKLEAGSSRTKAAVLSYLVPYPVVIASHESGGFEGRLLDFGNLKVVSDSRDGVIDAAQGLLLRLLMAHFRSNRPVPAPDHYLEFVPEKQVEWIDPLGQCELDLLAA